MTSELFVVPLSDRVNVSTAAGGQGSFTYNFPIQNAADLLVIRESAAGVQTVLTYVDDYTVTGVGEEEGGTVVLVEAATAGQKFYRIGKAVTERLTSIVRAGKYKSQALDDDLARAMIIAQEIMRDAARAWKSEYGVSGGKITVGTSGQVATFDSNGNLVGTTPVDGVSGLPAGGTAGQVMVKQSNESYDAGWQSFEGGGDMAAATYDPNEVGGDAFDMDNMVEGDTTKILTNTERNKLANIESNATADQTGAEIKTAYEAQADTNAFDDDAVSKLAGIAAGAEVNPATASEAEAEAGTETEARTFSPALIAAAIAALSTGGAKIYTGTYTGDGSTGTEIDGLGFQPKFVMIARASGGGAFGNSNDIVIGWDTLLSASGDAIGWDAAGPDFTGRSDAITAYTSDGFIVDDAGTDAHPNSNGVTYAYIAIG